MESHLPHLVVKNFDKQNFTTAKKLEIPPLPHPKRDRTRHSAYLKQQLEQAWTDAKNDEVVYHSTRKGIYLEFKGEDNYTLVTKSLENRRSKNSENWIRLLNVRSEKTIVANSEKVTQYATVYVPKGKKNAFFNTIKKYATENFRDTDNPKNAALIESIADIQKALEVESFWQDNRNLIPADNPNGVKYGLVPTNRQSLTGSENCFANSKLTPQME